jgi:hypothetical protein
MSHNESYRRILNKLGYYNYQQGLIYRHLKQGSGWNTHLENCRTFILRALDYYKPHKVTVLGSGWLLDLPLSEMLENTESINLIDIVHPPEVINQVSYLKKVTLSEMDITGGLIKEVWEKAGKRSFLNRLRTLENITIPEFDFPDNPGMVISLNILTQLEILLVEFLNKRAGISKEEYQIFRAAIQKKHLDFLVRYKSVLITDVTEVFTDKSEKITDIHSLLIDLPEGLYKEEWTWYFDLKRSDYYKKRSIYKVVAIIL